ncbi:hypothetical protein EMGBS3_15440 [Anaerolineaceae bacterium]|nr:hypothetical protein EMGBS3_15440 [Anaerolineaceae bacterium]
MCVYGTVEVLIREDAAPQRAEVVCIAVRIGISDGGNSLAGASNSSHLCRAAGGGPLMPCAGKKAYAQPL